MNAVIALNPISFPPPPVAAHTTRLATLGGTTVGFLSNNKPNADVLLQRIAVRLRERFGIVAKAYNKGIPSLEAPAELLGEVGRDCQAVVLAVYD